MTALDVDQPLPGMPMSTEPTELTAEEQREAFRREADALCAKKGHGPYLEVLHGFGTTDPEQVGCRRCGRTWRLTPDDGLYG